MQLECPSFPFDLPAVRKHIIERIVKEFTFDVERAGDAADDILFVILEALGPSSTAQDA